MNKILYGVLFLLGLSICSCSSNEKKAQKVFEQYLTEFYGSKDAFIPVSLAIGNLDGNPILNNEIYELGKDVALAMMSYSELEGGNRDLSFQNSLNNFIGHNDHGRALSQSRSNSRQQVQQCSILLDKLPVLYEKLTNYVPTHYCNVLTTYRN